MLVGCQKEHVEQVVHKNNDTQGAPLLTLSELLSASDIQSSLSELALEKDREGLLVVQSMLLEAAAEVRLDEKELALISGENGIVFLEFQGMRINFNNEFERAFFSFGDIESVYSRYPAFVELKARTQTLVENRDALVDTIRNDLEANGTDTETSLNEARNIWRQLMAEQGLESISI